MHDQFVVSIQDLRHVTVLCRQCNTKVTLDLEIEFPPPRRVPFKVPNECPRCQSPFDSAIPGAIEGMYKIYKALSRLGNAVSFTREADPPEARKGE